MMLWLRWCSRKYDIPNIDPHMFGFNGRALCVMTKAMFKYRVSSGKGALVLYTVSRGSRSDVLTCEGSSRPKMRIAKWVLALTWQGGSSPNMGRRLSSTRDGGYRPLYG